MFSMPFTGAPEGERRQGSSWIHNALGFVAMLVVAIGLVGCGSSASNATKLQVSVEFAPELRVGDTTCTLELRDAAGEPVLGAQVELEGNMNHAGMVPSFGTGEELGNGIYEAPLELTMGGDWFLIVSVTLADGSTAEEIVDLPGVAPRKSAADSQANSETSDR